MGFFDLFKKKTSEAPESQPEPERLENYPEMLMVKLLFEEKPRLNAESILEEAKKYFDHIDNGTDSGDAKALLFGFPDIRVELADANIPAQCSVLIPNDNDPELELPTVAFQQNWHWPEANEAAKKCRYEVLVTDMMSRTLEYKQRLNLFMNFLVAVTKATNPDVVYAVHGQKLIKPTELIANWDSEEKLLLDGIFNVRLYNVSDSAQRDLLMDTVGLHSIGLPDFQIRFSDFQENEIARLLWNYAYYIYENGDLIENGNTLEGTISGSKWKCERLISSLQPERMIINVQPV
jgi:hypothetical protein